jgi:hypothetical protein
MRKIYKLFYEVGVLSEKSGQYHSSNNKYLETWFKYIIRSSPPPFVKEILYNYEHDYGELWAIVASPSSPSQTQPVRRKGIGKSVLAVKILIHTYYRYLNRLPSWDDIKQYIVFKPSEFIELALRLSESKRRVPLIVWDDAGEWLSRFRSRTKFVAAVAESMEVLRTITGNIMFTATSPGKLTKGIRESLSYLITVAVIKHVKVGGRVVKVSRARVYHVAEDMEWLFNRRSMPKPIYEWQFNVWLPDEIYKPYFEYRQSFTNIAFEKVWNELRRIAAEEERELMSRDAEAEVEEVERNAKELASSIDIKDLRKEWGY